MRKIGEVVDGPGALDDRPTLNGNQYDYGIGLFVIVQNICAFHYLPSFILKSSGVLIMCSSSSV